MLSYFRSQLLGCDGLLHADQGAQPSNEDRASSCFANTMAMLPTQPASLSVLEYFYGASTRPSSEHFRLPGCVDEPITREGQGRKSNKVANAQVWVPRNNASDCLYTNMPYSKLAAIVMLARALNVSHLVESGRAGGLSLLHYAHFGFELTSIEMYPLGQIRATLDRRLPPEQLRMVDGNGNALVPEAIEHIAARDSDAKVGVILDGPKGVLAQHLAKRIAPSVAFVAVDDQHLAPAAWPGRLSWHVADPIWRALFPLERDLALTAGTAADRAFHHKNDDLSLLLGEKWR